MVGDESAAKDQEQALEVDELLARLRAMLPGGVPAVTEAERTALLDLARVVAHASQRHAAPLATFLAGCAYAHVPSSQRGSDLQVLVAELQRTVTGDPA
jgi:hypothetical protein